MKCAKCGADCDPRQLFCLRCGTPININKEDDEIKEVEVPLEGMVNVNAFNLQDDFDDDDDDIDLIIGRDLSRINSRQRNGYSANNNSYNKNETSAKEPEREVTVQNRVAETENRSPQKQVERRENNKKENDDNKKNIIIIASVIGIVIVALIVVLLVFVLGGKETYEDRFESGRDFYNKGRIEKSIEDFEAAADLATTDVEKKEVYSMLWDVYSQVDGYENNLIVALNELIALEPENISYYQALIVVYQDQSDQEAIDKLIDSVSDAELKKTLVDFDGTIPVATITPGEFDKAISVGLTAASGSTIYYNINGGKVKTDDIVYTGAIELKEEGTYIIKAMAVSSDGDESKQFEGKYILDFGTVNKPEINLKSGKYSENKKIKATCDEGCAIYYTTDGSTPTTSSQKYEKEILMPEKNTIYNFIAVDEKGNVSEVVSRVYSFRRTYTFDYNTAIDDISNVLVNIGKMENTFGSYEDGSAMYFEYVSVEEIDKEYYYIIKATKEAENGTVVDTVNYAYGCDNGETYIATGSAGSYTLTDID